MPSPSALTRALVVHEGESAPRPSGFDDFARLPRAWRTRARVDVLTTAHRLHCDGTVVAETEVEVGGATVGSPPGVYVRAYGEPTYRAGSDVGEAPVELVELVQSPDARHVRGVVRVRNFAFEKRVTVRLSDNGWNTFSDIDAEYVSSIGVGHDIFAFSVALPPPRRSRRTKRVRHIVELAVCFECAGGAHWDNNVGRNYRFTLAPVVAAERRVDRPRSRPPRAPAPSSLADRERERDLAASRRARSLQARFFAAGAVGDRLYDRTTLSTTSKLPRPVRYNADVFASVWLDRRSRLDPTAVDEAAFGPPPPVGLPDEGRGERLRAWRRLRPYSPWRPLLICAPPGWSPAGVASSSSGSSTASSSSSAPTSASRPGQAELASSSSSSVSDPLRSLDAPPTTASTAVVRSRGRARRTPPLETAMDRVRSRRHRTR